MEGPNTAGGNHDEPADGTGAGPGGPEADGSGGGIAAPPAPEAPAEAEAPAKKKGGRRKLVIVLVVVLVLVAAVAGVAYFMWSSQFVTTDNAQVDGDQVQINAPATGTLVDWNGVQGAEVKTGQILGRVKMEQGFAQPQQTIKSPGTGTIAVNNAVEGQWVTSGANLATAYDFNKIYVTARVDETDVAGVHYGAPVDISVDSFSGAPITGVVTEIQGAAADQFSLFPEANTDGNFQKVTQVIAVRIMFTNTDGKLLLPGMNVTVHIHKNP